MCFTLDWQPQWLHPASTDMSQGLVGVHTAAWPGRPCKQMCLVFECLDGVVSDLSKDVSGDLLGVDKMGKILTLFMTTVMGNFLMFLTMCECSVL